MKHLCRPHESWGPALPENRKRYFADLGRTELVDVCVYPEKAVKSVGNGVHDEANVVFLPKS